MNQNKNLTCFTIGHSNHSIETFIQLLKEYNINCLIDVRSMPYSKFHPQFNKDVLKESLQKKRIFYLYMGNLLGGRYTAPNLLYPDGKVNFKKVRETKNFKSGIDRIIQGLEENYSIALMCSEKEPLNCHRFILISYELEKRGIAVKHILDTKNVVTNVEEEKKLINKYYKNSLQISLFEPCLSQEELLEDAYEKRNKEIAYTA